LKIVKGTPQNIVKPIIGRVKKGNRSLAFSKDIILTSSELPRFILGCGAVVTSSHTVNSYKVPSVFEVNEQALSSLDDGDIVQINQDGSIQVLWESNSHQNAFFITDYCNSACIMCPQKAVREQNSYAAVNKRILSLIQDPDKVEHIGITGGEPTICIDNVVNVLKICKDKFPGAAISLLTNGKLLADFDKAQKLASANHNVKYCIPLYAPTDFEHDYIVGSPGSFEQTILGIYNLARFKCPVEIRIVVIKQNYKRLTDLAEFIYQNMPFVVHVAIMGMETTGVAKENLGSIWIDPHDYQEELSNSIVEMHRRALNVSIYNLSYCLLPKALWRFARDSISGWKKAYLEQCTQCCVKDCCGGTFATSVRQSSYIAPLSSN
jgi:His-Xaa-Ser repeat-associated downstream radical SAM protein